MTENLREIASDWLRCCGFGGLFNDRCACSVDELFPCGNPSPDCRAGYAIACCECSNTCCAGNTCGFDYIISESNTCPDFEKGGSYDD